MKQLFCTYSSAQPENNARQELSHWVLQLYKKKCKLVQISLKSELQIFQLESCRYFQLLGGRKW